MSVNLEPETYVLKEMQKLRNLYEIALKSRLDNKKRMREIVVRWQNLRLSQFFMKWKALRKKYSAEEMARMKFLLSIKRRRLSQVEAIKANRERANRKKYYIANAVRNEAHISAIERRAREENERRVKTARAYIVRTAIKSRFTTPRKEGVKVPVSIGMHQRTKSLF